MATCKRRCLPGANGRLIAFLLALSPAMLSAHETQFLF